jgi:hypothetical protein
MLHDQATASTLGMARIWVFGLAAISRIYCPLWEVCYLPDYYPVGIMKLLGADLWVPLLNLPLAIAFQIVTVGLLLAVTAGVGPYKRLAPLACIALTVSEGMVRGDGVIPHAHMILLLTTYILCAFPAADALTLFRRPDHQLAAAVMYRAPLVAASLVMGFTYMFAAVRRFSAGGVSIYLNDSILSATALRDAELGSAGGYGIWACETFLIAWALRIGFPVVTLLEFLSPMYVFSKRFRWIWIAVMVPFHIGTGFLMGIWFTYNLALIPLLVAGFDPFRVRDSRQQKPGQPDDTRLDCQQHGEAGCLEQPITEPSG